MTDQDEINASARELYPQIHGDVETLSVLWNMLDRLYPGATDEQLEIAIEQAPYSEETQRVDAVNYMFDRLEGAMR